MDPIGVGAWLSEMGSQKQDYEGYTFPWFCSFPFPGLPPYEDLTSQTVDAQKELLHPALDFQVTILESGEMIQWLKAHPRSYGGPEFVSQLLATSYNSKSRESDTHFWPLRVTTITYTNHHTDTHAHT